MQTKIYSLKDIYMKIHYNIAHLIYDYCAESALFGLFRDEFEQ